MDPWQLFPDLSNFVLLPAILLSAQNVRFFGLPLAVLVGVEVNSLIMHTCRMVGPVDCAYLDNWMLIDYIGSQFLVAMIAIMLTLELTIGERDSVIGIWFVFHCLLFALNFYPEISLVLAIFLALRNLIFYWNKLDQRLLILSLIAAVIGIIFYPISLPKPAILAHTIWHIFVMGAVDLIFLVLLKFYNSVSVMKLFVGSV